MFVSIASETERTWNELGTNLERTCPELVLNEEIRRKEKRRKMKFHYKGDMTQYVGICVNWNPS